MKKENGIVSFVKSIFSGGQGYETETVRTSPLPKKTILMTVVLTVLVLFLVFSFIEISALSSDIAALKKEEVNLRSRETKLSDDLSHKYPEAELLEAIAARGFTGGGGQTVILPEDDA